MTDSYQNLVGTPRDQIPGYGIDNYAATDADLSKEVNESINDDIKDTKAFFDQMVEIEKLAAEAPSKRMAAIQSIIGSVGTIKKAFDAKEADKVSKVLSDKIKEQITEADQAYTDEINSINSDISQAKGDLDADNKSGAITTQNRLEVEYGLDTIEDELNRTTRQFLKNQENNVALINDILASNGSENASTISEHREYQTQALNSWVRNVVYDARNQGIDFSNERQANLFVRKLGKVLSNELKGTEQTFKATFREKVLQEKNYNLNTRIIESVKGASIINEETGARLDSTFFGPNGVVQQIADEKFKGDIRKGEEYALDLVGILVDRGDLQPNEVRELIYNLEYTDANGKKHESFKAFADTIGEGKGAKGRIDGMIQRLSGKVIEIENKVVDRDIKQRRAEANNFVNKEVIPRIFANKQGDPPVDGLTETQVGFLINNFKQQKFYLEGVTEIPQVLLTYQKETHTGGPSRNKNVIQAQKYADNHNDTYDRIKLLVAQKELQSGDTSRLGRDDLYTVDKIFAAFLEKFRGKDGKNQDLIDVAIGRGDTTYADIRLGILNDLEKDYNSYRPDKNATFLPSKLGVQDVLKTRDALNTNPELFKKKEAFNTEPVDKLAEYLDSGGARNPELVDYYKALRIRVPDGEGGFRVLGGEEAIYDRGITLGILDKDTLKVDFDAQILKDFRKVNDMKTYPNDNKALRNYEMPEDEKKAFGTWLEGYARVQGGEENKYRRVGGGRAGTGDKTNLKRLNGSQVVATAKNGSTDFGLYKIPGYVIIELDQAGLINKDRPFDENEQSRAVINYMALKIERKSSSIRGAVTPDNVGFGKSVKFTTEEDQALDIVFPNLTNSYFSKFSSFDKEIAEFVITEVEKAQKDRAQRVEELKQARTARDKKKLRGRD